jgi:hypothetical protein
MPMLVYPTHFKQGILSNSFDLRLEKATMIQCEWRDYSQGGHKTGPRFSIRNAMLSLDGGTKMELPENEWIGFEILSGVGPEKSGKWSITVKVPGQPPKVFNDLAHADTGFGTLTWISLSSTAETTTSYYLDNFKLKPAKSITDAQLDASY